MSLESVIQYIIHHNTSLIEALIALVLLSALFLAFRSLKAPELGDASSGTSLSELEATLKKLLEKASVVPAANATSGDSGPSKELLAEIEKMKKALEERQAEIESLKTAAGANPPSMDKEEKMKLESQLKELQGKLTEYEIISEDIADLSFYKEENVKLQKQLEGLKTGGAPAPSPAAAEPPPAAPAPPEPEIVGKSKIEEAAAVAAAPAAAEPAPSTVDNDLMAEFDKAVEEQNANLAVAAEEPNLGSMNMDKMLAEAEGIEEKAGPAGEDTNALEKGLDADKLLQEADALADVKTEDKKLMNEFENFVKKG